MSALGFLREVFREKRDAEAFVWRDAATTYERLLARMDAFAAECDAWGLAPGTVTMVRADFSPDAVALLLALFERGAIVVPVTPHADEHAEAFRETAQAEVTLRCDEAGGVTAERHDRTASHELYDRLRADGHAGLVLFSSGSTGKHKGVVHDLTRLLGKFRRRRHDLRTLAFLLLDHIGGIDTLFYSLSNGSCLVVPGERTPEAVCAAVERHRVQVLPVAPSFLNLLLVSGEHRRHDLSSLVYVTYGAEMMPQSTLDRCAELFPNATLLQKYGTSEVGTLRSQSRDRDSLWVRVGGEGYRTRVVDGKLEILAESSMLGYLNAPSPFTDDGWFRTGDLVETDGEWIRFLGRDSDIINVGGRKVFPAEVEAVIAAVENVAEAAIHSEPNAFMGAIVCARVRTVRPEPAADVVARVRAACRGALESYKIPVRIEVTDEPLTTIRGKTVRTKTVRRADAPGRPA